MKRIKNALALTALVTGGATAPATAQSLPEGVTEVATVEGITEYRLDNGLRFLLFPDQSKQQITVNITYLVGSRHEGYGETGMAHLLEHLVFKGSPGHTDIPAVLGDPFDQDIHVAEVRYELPARPNVERSFEQDFFRSTLCESRHRRDDDQ